MMAKKWRLGREPIWLRGIKRELLKASNDDIDPITAQMVARIADMRSEAAAGNFTTAYGDITITNRALAALVYYACVENWLCWLAEEKGRPGDSERHETNYRQAMSQIQSDTFTKEDHGLAFCVLD